MSRDTSKDKEREQAKGKKLTVTKQVIKDLEPRRAVRAGAAWTQPDLSSWRQAANHNETLVLDITMNRKRE